MTKEKFEQAKMLEDRINHISRLIESLERYEYRLEPPTRKSNYTLYRGSACEIDLNEGEVVFIKEAFKNERDRLKAEFWEL